jgi:mono/diheme cytochrome c family protein
MNGGPLRSLVVLLAAIALVASAAGEAQQPRPAGRVPESSAPHAGHATPENWKFSWPNGDAARGREVFVKFECYACHEVRGAKFPSPTAQGKVGPELASMGPLHEPEYFAEAIVNPNAVIEKGKGYAAPDGSSKMPSFNDSMTVQEAVDLVAYLRSLKPPTGGGAEHKGH